ncbi:NEDD8-activating enzyme E1 regulatory subunit, partial [Durusdinium trenchii]
AGPTGTETLKNLVLPGIGRFTVVDDGKVDVADTSNNFFVTADAVGKPRAEVTCGLLNELNPDVQGSFKVCDPLEFARDATNLHEYSLVVVTELPEKALLELEVLFRKARVPVVVARTYGFVGICRVLTMEPHCVIESKPSPAPLQDIRIADPFPALQRFVDEVDLGAMDDKEYKHVPYVLVLIKLAQRWRADHGDKAPQTMEEKNAFRASIKEAARQEWGLEENLREAHDNAFLAFSKKLVPGDVQDVLDDPLCESPPASLTGSDKFNAHFWAMTKALKAFVADPAQGNGKLPLSGKLPDMTATTSLYVQLQQLFQEEAAAQVEQMLARVQKVSQELGWAADEISKAEVELLCKNAADLRAIRLSSLSEEVDKASINKDEVEMAVMEDVGDSGPQCPVLFYFMVRACDRFWAEHGRFPGQNGQLSLDEGDTDAATLLGIAQTLVSDFDFSNPVKLSMDHATEFVRYAGCEMHNIAAVIGGIASQEAVKLLTHQYTLLDGVYVFNGITCTGASYSL